ncbi:hypothetical protein BaRGS_00015425 [Batillaria attramentaria]|uniref:chitin synthase n=1 Tax=Batillaria attramentaria TaxID=370345 RepID=A0ABD0L2G6_9CAEN
MSQPEGYTNLGYESDTASGNEGTSHDARAETHRGSNTTSKIGTASNDDTTVTNRIGSLAATIVSVPAAVGRAAEFQPQICGVSDKLTVANSHIRLVGGIRSGTGSRDLPTVGSRAVCDWIRVADIGPRSARERLKTGGSAADSGPPPSRSVSPERFRFTKTYSWDIFKEDIHQPSSSISSRTKKSWAKWDSFGTFLLCVVCFCVVLGTATLSKLTLLLMVHNLPTLLNQPLIAKVNSTGGPKANNAKRSSSRNTKSRKDTEAADSQLDKRRKDTEAVDSHLDSTAPSAESPSASSVPSSTNHSSGSSLSTGARKETCSTTWPTLREKLLLFGKMLLTLFVEAINTAQLTILVFVVLPSYDPYMAFLLLLNTTFLPALIRFVEDVCRKRCDCRGLSRFAKDISGLGCQVAALALLGWDAAAKNMGTVPIAVMETVLVLVPIAWCGNYLKRFSKLHENMTNLNLKQHKKCYFFVSLLKIGFPVLAVFAIYHISGVVVTVDNWVLHSDDGSCNRHLPYILASANIISSFVCYVFATVACKMRAQKFCFAIPLMLAPVLTFGLMHLSYFNTISERFLGCDAIGLPLNARWGILQYAALLCSYLAYVVIGRHVLTRQKTKILQREHLFKRSCYCGIFVDSSLIFTRIRKDRTNQDAPMESAADSKKSTQEESPEKTTPFVYVCATMWHEERDEMVEMMNSIVRLSNDQRERKEHDEADDYYEFEAHIFFDDAFEPHGNDEDATRVNSFVQTLKDVVDEYKEIASPPKAVATPYGGRLTWKLPGENKLVAHLKDKAKIRNKKRWSQVMYMYYFLAHELHKRQGNNRTLAKNTFLLALDGDVDFQPDALLLLIDRLKISPDVGAACGRIHPIGTGPMVWYQEFEYAASHWLLKSAEHVFGCVLCSPGCFSLFRGSALMDDNVMKTYTTPSTEARHFVQYDQGEDRWLCTLLLQQGYRVEYCAASDSYTHAPEGFNELFNQRRRWNPSTMANIIDLLRTQATIRERNQSISYPYIIYQFFLFLSTIVTPGTIFLLVVGALSAAFPVFSLVGSFAANLIPVAIFVIVCFNCKQQTQLLWALILSVGYMMLMTVVIIGLVRKGVDFGVCSVTTIFLCLIVGVFLLSAILHTKEFGCVIHGFLYFLLAPSTSMLLIIYSLANLHVVSWGTREAAKPQGEKGKKGEDGPKGFLQRFLSALSCSEILRTDIHGRRIGETRHAASKNIDSVEKGVQCTDVLQADDATLTKGKTTKKAKSSTELKQLWHPSSWTSELELTTPESLDDEENTFWKDLINRYLLPLKNDPEDKKTAEAKLVQLRNGVCLSFFVSNGVFVSLVFTMAYIATSTDSLTINLPCNSGSSRGEDIQPISVAFMAVFGILLILQFFAMLWHRAGTMIHIASDTKLCRQTKRECDDLFCGTCKEQTNTTADAEEANVEREVPYVPEVERHVPRVEQEVPRVEQEVPRVEQEVPEVERDVPKVEHELPKVEREVPKVEREVPEVEREVPEVEREVPKVERQVSIRDIPDIQVIDVPTVDTSTL